MSKTVVSTFGTLDNDQIDTLKKGMSEISDVMTMMDSSRETIKEIYKHLYEELEIPKSILRKMAVTYYKRNYEQVSSENSEFESLYESVIIED